MKRLFLLFALVSAFGGAETNSFRSSARAAHVIELYSSEGCSSCPPAEEWMNSLHQSPGLWKEFVPVEFHVDYWNRLGWHDPFSKAAFTSRQNAYAAEWQRDSVYTPAFSLDGREWKTGLFWNNRQAPTSLGAAVGVLTAQTRDGESFDVTFEPSAANTEWETTAVIMGKGLVSQVGAGENARKTLAHEFAVLALARQSLKREGTSLKATVSLKHETSATPKGYRFAAWVSRKGFLTPVQAVGGELSIKR